tara:strand:+ start:1068 stop:1244 length:177 start_codon:yes stop_codon:yes gene_type:complete
MNDDLEQAVRKLNQAIRSLDSEENELSEEDIRQAKTDASVAVWLMEKVLHRLKGDNSW